MSLPRSTVFSLAMVFVVGVIVFGEGVVVRAQEPKVGEGTAVAVVPAMKTDVLENFFKLGLPDVRNARWVQWQHGGLLPGPFSRGYELEGNAWLIDERPDGTVTLLTGQSLVLKGWALDRTFSKKRPKRPDLQEIWLSPADLDNDVKVLARRLRKMLGEAKPEDGPDKPAVSNDFMRRDAQKQLGELLLFTAHLYHRGNKKAANELLPLILKLDDAPGAALDQGISFLAGGRLSELTKAWARDGNTEAYALGVERLVGEFLRGWNNREGAELLVRRLREQKPPASESKGKEGEDFLLGLKLEWSHDLPFHTNWLIPGGVEKWLGEVRRINEATEAQVPEKVNPRAAEEIEAMRVFFAKPREVLAMLGRLLDDERYLRASNDQIDLRVFDDERVENPETRVQSQYDKLSRPMELRELALRLIDPVLPARLTYVGTRKKKAVVEWLKSVEQMSDEELAWDYLRNAEAAREPVFDLSIRFLIEKGGPETLAKLAEVLHDPAVWREFDAAIDYTEKYLKRYTEDVRIFAPKVLDAARNAQQAQNEGSILSGEWGKRIKAENAAQMKLVEQLFKPLNLAENLAEIVVAEEEEAMARFISLHKRLEKLPRAELEALLFPSAVKAKSLRVREAIISAVQFSLRDEFGALPKNEPRADDAVTRAAMMTLLADRTPCKVVAPFHLVPRRFDEVAARAIVLPRLPIAELLQWVGIFEAAPTRSTDWLIAEARAIASGELLPQRPDATRISVGARDALLAQLAALPPEPALALLGSWKPDEQLAVLNYLTNTKSMWPEGIAAAHLTVARVEGGKAKSLNAERWRGRRFDEALVSEVTDAVEKALVEGNAVEVILRTEGVLDGVTLSVEAEQNFVNLEALEDYDFKLPVDKERPLGVIEHHTGKVDPQGEALRGYRYPFWKDQAIMKAWSAANRGGYWTNPEEAERILKAFTKLEPKSRNSFIYGVSAVRMVVEEKQDAK